MKKIVSLAISALLGVCCLSGLIGCGTPKRNVSADEYTLDFNLPSDYTADVSLLIPTGTNESGIIDNLIDGFKQKYPNINVTYNVTNQGSMDSTVRNNYMSDALEDIIWTNSPDFAFLVANDLVFSLDSYMEQAEKAGVYDFDEDFYMQAFDFAKIGEKHYAFPRSMDSVVTHVNTDIVEKAGASELVHDGWTWDEFIEASKKIRAYMNSNAALSKNYVIDAYLTWAPVIYPILRSYGAEIIDTSGKVVINSDASAAALTMIRDVLVGEKIVAAYGTSGATGFEGGGSAFMFHSAPLSSFADKGTLKGKYDVVSFPLIEENDTPYIGAGLAGYTVTKSCRDKNACFAFMTFMLSREGQELMAEGGLNLVPVRKDLAADPNAKWRTEYPGLNADAYLYGMEYKVGQDFVLNADPKCKYDIISAVSDMVGRATDTKLSIQAVIERAETDLGKALLV